MIASVRFPIGLCALLLCLTLAPSVLADAYLVPLDGSEPSIQPADVGWWKIEFANGVVQTCEIRSDGTADVREPMR